VSARRRRRRALVLLSLALACGGLAASEVRSRVDAVERRTGPLVPALVAARDLPADRKLAPPDLAVHRVPARYLPRDALGASREALGSRTAVPVAAGAYVTASQLRGAGGRRARGRLRPGERAVEVAVAGGDALAAAAVQGSRVDVLVSSEPRDGTGHTLLALEDVELLALEPGSSGGGGQGQGARAAGSATATLRVTLRQAVYLTAAQNFAREVRLLPRPPGERRRARRTVIGAEGL
jgi:pilus assembly protein CpaB